MAYEIENVAVEPKSRGTNSKYPFADLEVGQSFVIPAKELKLTSKNGEPVDPLIGVRSLIAAAQVRFSTKTTDTRTSKTGKVVPVLLATKKFTAVLSGKNDRVGRTV